MHKHLISTFRSACIAGALLGLPGLVSYTATRFTFLSNANAAKSQQARWVQEETAGCLDQTTLQKQMHKGGRAPLEPPLNPVIPYGLLMRRAHLARRS